MKNEIMLREIRTMFDKILAENLKGYEGIKEAGKGTKWEMFFDYARLVYEIVIEKIRLISEIRRAYDKGDKSNLLEISEDIPRIKEKYVSVHILMEKMWMSANKVFGWEELDGRFGAVLNRLDYAKRTLENYADGKTDEIQELEYDFIEDMHGAFPYGGVSIYRDMKSTGL